MSELPIERTSGTQAAVEAEYQIREKAVLRKEGKKWIGSGNEKVAFVDPRSPDRVIAIDRPDHEISAKEAEEIYYCHNIFATVFPHNFPKIYDAYGIESPEDKNHSGTLRERIQKKWTIPLRNRMQSTHPFSEVTRICEDLDVPLLYDSAKENFMNGTNGGQYYTDLLIVPLAL